VGCGQGWHLAGDGSWDIAIYGLIILTVLQMLAVLGVSYAIKVGVHK